MTVAALEYVAIGWTIIPLVPETKVPPKGTTWVELACNTGNDVIDRWTRWPNSNIGVLCGPSGLTVIDVDDPAGYELLPRLPSTATASTGRGRHHVYEARPGTRVRNSAGRVYVNGVRVDTVGLVDVRGDGGLFVAPPSRHRSGRRYRWDDDTYHYGFQQAPLWLTGATLRSQLPRTAKWGADDQAGRIDAIIRRVATAPEGTRNAVLFWASCRLGEIIRSGSISTVAAVRSLRTAATTCGLNDRETDRTIKSGITRGHERVPR